VDESAADGLPELAGYHLRRGVDSPGFDLTSRRGSLQDLKARCDRDPRCAGFTSLGTLKTRIRPAHQLVRRRFIEFGLYVKDARRGEVGAPRPRRRDQLLGALRHAQLRAALRHFRVPSVPTVTILKREHGHMFDSLRVGWDLLTRQLGCTYLCCLDSDTIVVPRWMEALRQLHQEARGWAPNPFTIVTGFNARPHPILADHATYRLKQSVGGINLFFHANAYPVLRPALTHVDWDHEIVDRIRRLQGTLICTRPSVVQHCGRAGLWSRVTAFDVAHDFEEGA
jgi:hypothetical protein